MRSFLQAVSDPLQACWGQSTDHSSDEFESDEAEMLCKAFDRFYIGCRPAKPGSILVEVSVWGRKSATFEVWWPHTLFYDSIGGARA